MAGTLDTKAYLDTVCDLLRQGHTGIAVPVTGSSMVPFLHNGDLVYLDLPGAMVRRGDVVLYTRDDGSYILHRVWKVCRDGSLRMVGDAQQMTEQVDSREQLHAVVTAVRHKGRLLTPRSRRWWFYRHVWLLLRPVRHRLLALAGRVKGRPFCEIVPYPTPETLPRCGESTKIPFGAQKNVEKQDNLR